MAELEKLKKIACDAIDNVAGELHEVSQEIWSHPELNYEEHHAHDILTKFLEKHECPVERHYLDIDTAFRTSVGEGKPHVSVLCEYDALPEIGHACGHNLIAEVGVGAGLGIKAAIQASAANIGKLSIFGTPAEEGGGGKIDFINKGCFKDVSISMMSHPTPYTDVKYSTLIAIQRCEVVYRGRESHAAAFPWDGINALDAAVLAYNNISCLRQRFKPSWIVHGVILHGGVKANIIPDMTKLEYFVRAPTMGQLAELKTKVIGCLEAAASATECKVEIIWDEKTFENLMNNQKLGEVFEKNASSLGVEFSTDRKKIEASKGSTDMGNVSHVVPSIHPVYYIGGSALNHTRAFTALAGSEKAQKYTLDQAKALAMTALDVMCRPELLHAINDKFQEDMKADAQT